MTVIPARPRAHHGNQRGAIVTIARQRPAYVLLPRRANASPLPQGPVEIYAPGDYYDISAYGEGRYGRGTYGA